MPMSTITVAGISPTLKVWGNTQQFNFNQNTSCLQLTNSFVPSISIPSITNQEVRNYSFSGYRWIHTTLNTDTTGTLKLQSFVNALTTGTDLVSFNEDGTINLSAPITITSLSLGSNLDMNSNRITDMDDPIDPQDGATQNFVTTTVNAGTITLTGAVTGTGNVNGTVSTTLTPITVSEISDFTTAVTAFTLDDFAPPAADIDFNTQRATNAADPVDPQDLATKNFVVTLPEAAIFLTGNSTPTTVLADTFTKIVGTTSSAFLNQFTMPSDNRVQYTGADTIHRDIIVNVSVSHDVVTGSTLGIVAFQNGSQITDAAVSYAYQLTQNVLTTLQLVMHTQLATNDYIEIFIISDNAANLIVQEMNFIVK